MIAVKRLRRRQELSLAGCLMLLLLVGCGGSAPAGTSDADHVADAVLGLSDIAGDGEAFQAAFASGSVPEDREAYAGSAFEVTGFPEISGDQATVEVTVISGIVNSQSGDGASEDAEDQERTTSKVTWTLQKEGDVWKIKDAPLK